MSLTRLSVILSSLGHDGHTHGIHHDSLKSRDASHSPNALGDHGLDTMYRHSLVITMKNVMVLLMMMMMLMMLMMIIMLMLLLMMLMMMMMFMMLLLLMMMVLLLFLMMMMLLMFS